MGAIELIVGAWVALRWLLSAAAVLAGSAAVLLVALSLPPVYLRARVDPLHFDEETPWDWDDVPFEADLSALFGALHVRFERKGGDLRVGWRFFTIARPIRADGGRREGHPPGELGQHGRRGENGPDPGRGRRRFSRSKSRREDPAALENARRRRRRAVSLKDLQRLVPEVRWLLAQARRRMKLEARGALVYGFSDPFATAVAHMATAALPPLPELRLQPDYARGTLRGRVELSLRAYPWQAVFLLVRACFRPNVRSLWWPRVQKAVRLKPKKAKEVVTS